MPMDEQIMALIRRLYDNMQAFYVESGLTSAELAHILQQGPFGADEMEQFQLCHALHLSMDKFAVGVVAPEETVKNNSPVPLEDVVGELIFRLHDHPAMLGGSRVNPDVLDAFQNDLEHALTVAKRRQAKYDRRGNVPAGSSKKGQSDSD